MLLLLASCYCCRSFGPVGWAGCTQLHLPTALVRLWLELTAASGLPFLNRSCCHLQAPPIALHSALRDDKLQRYEWLRIQSDQCCAEATATVLKTQQPLFILLLVSYTCCLALSLCVMASLHGYNRPNSP